MTPYSATPHSAALHVGLKSSAPSGHLHNCFSTVNYFTDTCLQFFDNCFSLPAK
ncbi:hypothetical protein Barb4_05249 [Bacteroidales bacterium Barb4]|nr:hypothetical protein Barb4_05249 [Bacteroidales bacterium Barb4]